MESVTRLLGTRESAARRPQQALARRLFTLVRTCAALSRTWRQRVLQRRALADLDARLLRDIGVHARAARAEAGKWFWQR